MGVTIFVPSTTSQDVIERLRLERAEVRVSGAVWDEAHASAIHEARKEGVRLVHPFDDPELWKGHSSLIQEVFHAGVRPDGVLLSVGGGGLLCGVVEGLHAVGWQNVPVFAAETEGAASLAFSYQAGQLIAIPRVTSIATSLGAKKISKTAFEWRKNHAIRPLVVSDASAVEACFKFARDHKVLVEPACGAALAPIYDNLADLEGLRKVLVIVCGGFGVSVEKLKTWRATVV